jgi:tetratricopeptide (TPR) repeat protein
VLRRRARFVMVKSAVAIVLLMNCCANFAQQSTKGSQTSDSSLQGLYDAATRFQKEGDFDQAARGYQMFLAAALGELANSQARVGDYAKSFELFDDALALTPDAASLRRDYANAALQADDLKRAETLARETLDDSSDNPEEVAAAHRILGRVLHKTNRLQEARKELETAVALDSSFASEYDLAVVCLDLDDEQCAVRIFDGIEASSGDSPAIHMQFGLAYGNSDFAPRAVTEFKKVIAEDPRYPGAHYCMAAALLAGGGDEKTLLEAEAELKEELAISPNDFLTYAALGKIEAGYHKYAEAERDLKRAIALNPKNPDAFLYLGQMYFDTNRISEAEADLRRAIELTTDISRNNYQIQKAHFLMGRILMQEHHPQEAHAEMQIARAFADNALSKDQSKLAGLLATKPTGEDASDFRVGIAASTSHATDPTAGNKQREFQRQLSPAIADSYNNLGVIAATKESYLDAVKYFERAKAWNPSLEGLDYNMGRAAFMSSQFTEAIQPLSHYLRAHPGDSGTRGALAMSQYMTHDYKACLDALDRAGAVITSIPQMQLIYAESLVKTGQISPGKTRLEALEAAHPEIAEVHRGLGEIAELQKDWQKAIQELNSANRLDANDPETHNDLGKADLNTGNIANAILEFEIAVRLKPDNASFHEELANAYERSLRITDAEKEHRIVEQLKAVQAPVTGAEGSHSETGSAR